MNIVKELISSITQPLVDGYKSNQERKQSQETGEQKIAAAKLEGATQITLSDSEWEAISTAKQDSSWKDEYVTILVTLPIVCLLAGALMVSFFDDGRLLTGTVEGIKALASAGVDMGQMMTAVVFAAVGLKLWRGR